MNKMIKREKRQEKKEKDKKGRKLGGVSAALDFIVYGGKTAVHQVTINFEKCPGHFLEMWLRNKMKMPLPH